MTDISRIVKIWNKSPVPVFNVPVFNAYTWYRVPSFIFKKIPKIYLRNQKRYEKSPTVRFWAIPWGAISQILTKKKIIFYRSKVVTNPPVGFKITKKLLSYIYTKLLRYRFLSY